jgi:hypothetical protein
VACVRLLLEAGADPNMVNAVDGTFPLQMAAENGNPEMVRLLLEAGAEPNKVNRTSGAFPLLVTAICGHRQASQQLLLGGAAIDQIEGGTGMTPLAAALDSNCLRQAKDFLLAGADVAPLSKEAKATAERICAASEEDLGRLERAAEEKQRAGKTSGERRTPAFDTTAVVPGPWTETTLDDASGREFMDLLRREGVSPQSLRGIWSNPREIVLCHDERLRVRHAGVEIRSDGAIFACEILWFSLMGEAPIALRPGLDLSGLLRDLKTRGARLDFRNEQDRKRLAALALLVADPPRFPLPEGRNPPLAPGASMPRILFPEVWWHFSQLSDGPEGPQVELTWIEGATMARGRVVIPDDGVGLRFLPASQTLTRNLQASIPRYARERRGGWSALRALGA